MGQKYQMKKILALNDFGSKNDLCPKKCGSENLKILDPKNLVSKKVLYPKKILGTKNYG